MDDVEPDNPFFRSLAGGGIQVHIERTGEGGLRRALADTYDAITLELKLPDIFGLTFLRRLIASQVQAPVVVVSMYSEPEIQAEARRLGAAAFLQRPLSGVEMSAALRSAVAARFARAQQPPVDPPFGIVAASDSMRQIVGWLERVGHSDMTVMLTGETGTGKEIVARAIHQVSCRPGQFVPVNCGSIPEALLENELFGHRRGAYTGAVEDSSGLVEAAETGTLFLDEVAEIPPQTQVRFLRFLDDRRVRRLGETRERPIDVRVIAATNRSLQEETGRGRFRLDLYYRLSVAAHHIPPLRERPEDVEALVLFWLPRLARQHGKGQIEMTGTAFHALRAHDWPGNARELRNVLEHALCLAVRSVVTERDVSAAMSAGKVARGCGRVCGADRLQAELEANQWNRTATARRLGISRTTLWRRLKNSGAAPALADP